MHTIHFILMGKGGVGKSMIASFLAQYLKPMDRNLFCADTDPTNSTFSHYKNLKVQHFNISDENLKVDTRKFDSLINAIAAHEGDCVVDTGASSFLPLMHYLHENNMFELLQSTGRRVIVHTPLVGGQAMDETIRGVQAIFEYFNVPVLIWVNEYFGPVVKDGIHFRDSALKKSIDERLFGIVNLKELTSDTAGQDMKEMAEQYLTFDEMLDSPTCYFANRHRLIAIRKAIFDQLQVLDL